MRFCLVRIIFCLVRSILCFELIHMRQMFASMKFINIEAHGGKHGTHRRLTGGDSGLVRISMITNSLYKSILVDLHDETVRQHEIYHAVIMLHDETGATGGANLQSLAQGCSGLVQDGVS